MKESGRARIQKVMTHLNPTHPLTQTLCLLLAIGCASRVDIANTTGGASSLGGSTATGGETSTSGGSPGTCDTGSPGCVALEPTGGAGPTPQHTGGTGGTRPMCTEAAPPCSGVGGTAPTSTSTAAPVAVCTRGQNQTCNDIPWISSIWGNCEQDSTCTCLNSYVINPHTGKCNNPDQIDCYSPTQNIDIAYNAGAVGCVCDASYGLACVCDCTGRVAALQCANGHWQSIGGCG